MRKVSFLHSYKIQELAAGKVQSTEPQGLAGKRKALGDVTFSAQLSASDTVTVNGVTFTAVAAGATGHQFNLGAALTNTIDNLVAAVNAAKTAEIAAIVSGPSGTVTQNGTPIEPFAEYAPGMAPAGSVVLSGASYSNVGGTKFHVDAGYGSKGNSFLLAVSSAVGSVAADNSASGVAAADIVFSGQPTANDTFTVQGQLFTAVAGAPAANQFQIGAALTNTIDNFVAALNAASAAEVVARANAVNNAQQGVVVFVQTKLSSATYSNVGGTKLHIAGVNGALVVAVSEGSATASVLPGSLQGGNDADLFNLDMETKALVTTPGSTVTEFDLPAGEEGQETTVYLQTLGAGSNAQVNGAFAGGHTTLTLSAVGQFQKLKFLGSSWVSIAGTGTIV